MSSSRQPGAPHPADEQDPTGVRALLSSLPDPGPMPEHVVARIRESLEQEQQVRQRTQPAAPRHDNDLATRRAHREQARRPVPRWAPWAGAAAAVAAGAMVVSTQFLGGSPMADITASVGGNDSGGAESAGDAGDPRAGDAGAGAESGEELAPLAEEDAGGEAGVLEDSAGDETGGEAAEPVVELGDRTGGELTEWLRQWYAGGPVASPWDAEAATSCARAGRLDPPEAGAPSAYPARWQDGEAVVLLLPSVRDAEEAWLVEARCTGGGLADVLHGPVPLSDR